MFIWIAIIVLMLIYDIIKMVIKFKKTKNYYALVSVDPQGNTKVYLSKTHFFAKYRASTIKRFSKKGYKHAIVATNTYGECFDSNKLN